ncbi:hypothetical protein Pyn_00390 [Prunus yedoensis var. nudiflora]|uniref:Uncharacterized protein n=1 Tax=Prunus yedoensis var. nudiflora TaxID=2094558 RepID=A0A314ZBZ2_PRUYE|nr:hypothetical protein Pyn_00390 [Prunus yedoensis var. nudiflora]
MAISASSITWMARGEMVLQICNRDMRLEAELGDDDNRRAKDGSQTVTCVGELGDDHREQLQICLRD